MIIIPIHKLDLLIHQNDVPTSENAIRNSISPYVSFRSSNAFCSGVLDNRDLSRICPSEKTFKNSIINISLLYKRYQFFNY